MCGIHLIWGKDATQEKIELLTKSARHRGPDQEAFYSPWPGLWVGVNRLKILHLGPEADQPFWSPDRKALLLWNGEIYNYQELRLLLENIGVEFLTSSDTEVVLHTLKIFGPKGLEKLQGMFSLIYLDIIEEIVLVGRDQNGEKPLYYTQNDNLLVISSEVRGISIVKEPSLDRKQITNYFFLRTPHPGNTFFQGISDWRPGYFSLIQQPSKLFWERIPSSINRNHSPDSRSFENALNLAVLSQFHADVPVGVSLSGGTDSSLLYAIWYKQTGRRLPTYTIQVEDKFRKKYGDGDAAIRLAKELPMDHRLIKIDQTVFWENWEAYIRDVDSPLGDSAGFLTWMIGKTAKEHVKVMISGVGADELWGGYNRHRAIALFLENKELLIALNPILKKLALGRLGAKFLAGLQPDPKYTFLNFSALHPVPDAIYEAYRPIFNTSLPEYKQMLDFDRQMYLVEDLLKIHDNALMAHGIEGRSPFLDARLVDIWESVVNMRDLKGKKWIKELLAALGMKWINERKKFGFGLPLKEWFAQEGEFAQRIYFSLGEFEKSHGEGLPTVLRDMLKCPQRSAKNHFLTLYNLFVLAEWVKLHKL